MSNVDSRIRSVQTYLKEHDLSALYISGTDVHLGEYVPERYRTREWITGFTGSAGTVIVTADECHLWVDSRYYIQGELQTAGTSVTLHLQGMDTVLPPFEWVASKSIDTLAVDGTTLSVDDLRNLEKKLTGCSTQVVVVDDVLDPLWEGRPASPFSQIREIPVQIAGKKRKDKIAEMRELMAEKGTDAMVITTLDDIAWVTNLRGRDLPYTPVFYSYLIITSDEVLLFTDSDRFDEVVLKSVSEDLTVLPYESFMEKLSDIAGKSTCVYLGTSQTAVNVYDAVKEKAAVFEEAIQISTYEKAKKNQREIEGFRRAHYLDGIALVRFLSYLDRTEEKLDEITVAQRLEDFRKKSNEYLFPSFAPIAGFGPHGAMEHYSASPESSSVLEGNSLLVLDTGGQYVSGTTDVTRTILFGEATEEMKRDYTLVLKGNIALSKARFPKGTCGYQLDILARQFLWNRGLTYRHGTGHGVGYGLSVHEGPFRISPHAIEVPLEPGHVMSDEPGLYRRDQYGIRIETLVTVFEEGVTEFGPFYSFEVLTLCPYERRLIEPSLLSDEELALLNAYHQWVYDELSRYLDDKETQWLRETTLPIEK